MLGKGESKGFREEREVMGFRQGGGESNGVPGRGRRVRVPETGDSARFPGRGKRVERGFQERGRV